MIEQSKNSPKRSTLRKLIMEIYHISMEELSANCSFTDHMEYIEYRICGGKKNEENWFRDQCK